MGNKQESKQTFKNKIDREFKLLDKQYTKDVNYVEKFIEKGYNDGKDLITIGAGINLDNYYTLQKAKKYIKNKDGESFKTDKTAAQWKDLSYEDKAKLLAGYTMNQEDGNEFLSNDLKEKLPKVINDLGGMEAWEKAPYSVKLKTLRMTHALGKHIFSAKKENGELKWGKLVSSFKKAEQLSNNKNATKQQKDEAWDQVIEESIFHSKINGKKSYNIKNMLITFANGHSKGVEALEEYVKENGSKELKEQFKKYKNKSIPIENIYNHQDDRSKQHKKPQTKEEYMAEQEQLGKERDGSQAKDLKDDNRPKDAMILIPEEKQAEPQPSKQQTEIFDMIQSKLQEGARGAINMVEVMVGDLFKQVTNTKTNPISDILSKKAADITEDESKQVMNSEEYRDGKNELSKLARGKVDEFFKFFFPGNAKYDEFGKMEQTPPIIPFPPKPSNPKTKDGGSPDDFMEAIGTGLQAVSKAFGGNDKKVVADYQETVNEENKDTKEPPLKTDGLFGIKTASATKRIAERKKAFELLDKTADKTMKSQTTPLGRPKPHKPTMGQPPINQDRIARLEEEKRQKQQRLSNKIY